MALLTGGSRYDKLIGTSLVDTLSGLAGNDMLFGYGGNDLLDGGAGNDLMRGGAGDDTYVVDSAGDVIDEQGALDTNDLVKSTISVNLNTLGAGLIEHATLLGTYNRSAVGNAQANKLVGNSGNNILSGGGENDTLNGGAGNDTMRGGAGNDTYVIDSPGDRIDEEGNGDSDDVVRTMVSVNLTTLAGGAIEHAILLGSSALNATGNGTDNRLTGNSGANRLNGGHGADTMIGGAGNDIYIVDDIGDQVIEQILGGTDLVTARMSFNLLSTPYVENLTLIGAGDYDARGNAADNALTGNSGANRLYGGGGTDTMIGGYGDDYYIVNSVGDRVRETVANNAGGGHDTVQSSISFSLYEHRNVEDLYLVGTRDIDGTGNARNNVIRGNDGDNILDGGTGSDILDGGMGDDVLRAGWGDWHIDYLTDDWPLVWVGDGADTLTGGMGRDTFSLSSMSRLDKGPGESERPDTITDFAIGEDGDILELRIFVSLLDPPIIDPSHRDFTFVQAGSDTQVWVGDVMRATLLNVSLTEADTANYNVDVVVGYFL